VKKYLDLLAMRKTVWILISNNIQLVFFFDLHTLQRQRKLNLHSIGLDDNIQQQNINYNEKNASQSQRPSTALT